MRDRLHLLTDARDGRDALGVVALAVGAGAGVVQVRRKGCTDRELYEFAVRVIEVCGDGGALCIVNDRVDVALAVGAPERTSVPTTCQSRLSAAWLARAT